MLYSVPPKPKFISPHAINVGMSCTFKIVGSGFESLTNVYLSGHPLHKISSEQDPFEKFPQKTSIKYPPFVAVKLLDCEWTYDGNSTVTFIMPSASCPGFVDVILENPAGYGSLINNVRVNVYQTPVSFIPYQFPFVNGIEVLPPNTPTTPVASLSGFILLDGDVMYVLQENGDRLELDFLLNNC